MAVLVQTALNQYVTKTSLAAAVAATDSANKTIVVTGAETVSASLTIPATRTLRVEKGATITVASGQILALNCPIDAGRYAIFAGTGTITGLQKALPDWWTTNATPGTTDMTSAFTAALAASDVVEGSGTYAISNTVTMGDSQKLAGNMTLKAITGMANKPMILIKEGDGSTAAWDVDIPNSIILDGNDIALTGVEVYYGRGCNLRPYKITRANKYGFLLGNAAASKSDGINIHDTIIWYHEEATPVSKDGSYSNPSDSAGIYYRHCYDSTLTNVQAMGFRVGFDISNDSSGNHIAMCHAWNRRAHGPLLAGFRTLSSNGTFHQCYSDTPHNWYSADGSTYVQDAAITALYGFYLDAYSQALTNCMVYLNSSETYGATDNLLTAVYSHVAGYGHILGLQVKGGDATHRYAKIYGGVTTNATIVGTGNPASGTLVDTTSVFDQVGVNEMKFATGKLSIDAAAGTLRELALKTAGVARWYIGASGTAEGGSDAGSDFWIKGRADDGSALNTPLTITRSTGYIKLGNVPAHADNAAAVTAGLAVGEVYRTADVLKIVHA